MRFALPFSRCLGRTVRSQRALFARRLCDAPLGRSVARTDCGSRWVASIDVNGTAYRIGEYDTEGEAAHAWDEWNALVASVDEQGEEGAGVALAAGEDDGGDASPNEAWSPPADEDDAAWDAPMEDEDPAVLAATIGVEPSLADVVRLLERHKAVDLVSLDIGRRCDWAAHMVIVTGRSLAHMRKMSDGLVTELKRRELDELSPSVEDRDDDEWMAVDAGDVIVHVFEEEARRRFDLESHWGGPEEDWPGNIYEDNIPDQ